MCVLEGVFAINSCPIPAQVRRLSAEQLYVQVLAGQHGNENQPSNAWHARPGMQAAHKQDSSYSPFGEDLESVIDLLMCTAWDGPVAAARHAAAQIKAELHMDATTLVHPGA